MIRFVCDEQLGRLAKWLRLQGFDTLFECPISDSKLIGLAQGGERILLTRDRDLYAKTLWEAVVLIREADYAKQLEELRAKVKLATPRPFSRCLECNELIRSLAKVQAKNRVPEEVYRSYNEFYTCPRCEKIFWRGTHVKNSEARLRRWRG